MGCMKLSLVAPVVVSILALTARVEAVIRPEMDVDTVYRLAGAVWIGKVIGVDAKAKTVEAAMAKDLKARGAADAAAGARKALIDLSAAAELIGQVRVGEPVVIFAARRKGGTIHVADTACVAPEKPAGAPPKWAVTRTQLWAAFPGVTPALVEALSDLAARKPWPQLNGVPHWMFPRYRRIAQLKARPELLACADVNGDRIPDLLTVEPKGIPVLGGPVLTDKRVYVLAADETLAVLNADSGRIIEQHRLNSPEEPAVEQMCVGGPLLVRGLLYVATQTGGLRCYAGGAQASGAVEASSGPGVPR